MPESAGSGPGARYVHVASTGTERSSKEGYDVSGILLHDALDLTVHLSFFLDIDCSISRVQKGVEFIVTIVRFGPAGPTAERQVYIFSRRNPPIPATNGKRPLLPLVPKG